MNRNFDRSTNSDLRKQIKLFIQRISKSHIFIDYIRWVKAFNVCIATV